MKLTKTLALVLALALMVCAFAACGTEPAGTNNDGSASSDAEAVVPNDAEIAVEGSVAEELGKGVVVMGTNAEFEPFEHRDNDEIVGYDIDTANEIADYIGMELKVEDMNFDSLINALVSGKIDMILAGMSVTEERKEVVNFSEPYYRAAQVIIVPVEGATVASSADLAGKRIGVQEGTTGDIYVEEEIEGAVMSRFKKAVDAAIDLSNGQIDAVVLDEQPAKRIVEQNPSLTILGEALTAEEYAIAVRKDNPVLLEEINKCLAELKINGKTDELLQKYALNVEAE